MYTQNSGPLSIKRSPTSGQIVVKLKRSGAARGVLHAAAAEGRMPQKRGALDRLLASRDVVAAEPIFDNITDRGLRGFRRMAMAAVSETDSKLAGLSVVSLPTDRHAKNVIKRLEQDPMIEFAYIIPEKYPMAADPMLNRQWGLNAIELFSAEAIASFPDPTDVTVAVIDSGIDPGHPDLAGVIKEQLNYSGSAQKNDTSGHGTHVTGTIAALINNAKGIRGVVSSSNIMSIKALDPYNGPGYYRALRYATDNGAKVINLSLGGGRDPTEELLVKRAINQGVAVVAAMGNDKQNGNSTSYPAAIARVIAVGATNETDDIADFSQTGRHIDLVAPGVNILSTIPTYPTSLANGTDYEAWPGTSMATPHVSAALALMIAKDPTLTVAKLRQVLVRNADKVAGENRFSSTYGHGRLNIRRMLDSM